MAKIFSSGFLQRNRRAKQAEVTQASLTLAVAILIFSLSGCASQQPEALSIKMVNPETQMTLMCSARDDFGVDRAVLAGVVETCARQLEARGFVRAK